MAEWCAEPSAPTSCALGCSDQGCSWKLVPAHAAGSPGCSWHQDQLRLGCRAPSWQPGKSLSHHSHRWERQARPVWLSISNASLGTGTVSGRKEDLLFVAVLKEGGGSHKHNLPFARAAHWRSIKCVEPKPVRLHIFPKLYQLKGRWERWRKE